MGVGDGRGNVGVGSLLTRANVHPTNVNRPAGVAASRS